MQKEIVRTQVRFPSDIMESLKEWARKDGRSMNSLLVQVVKEEKKRREINEGKN
ncbi:Arc family DNA-binding protein [Entomomonas moraniae]|uniref:Arc family DNA-binding protein n=1 Tax=Entomomonas moraniae TaxID=2213226 RepID=A0A3Q9JH16_9GAMM|nr:Arc family DNA-binding protein [Entomomonas moraniae]AZS49344.1 Arc family DNA-binding protein [Entomomonas moraniae]